MARPKLTIAQQHYIVNNYRSTSRRDMARQLGVGVTRIVTFMNKNNLKVSKEQAQQFRTEKMIGRTSFTKKEDRFIAENYLTMTILALARHLERSETGVKGRLKRMGLVIPQETLRNRSRKARFKKGHTPKNKGKKITEYMSEEALLNSKKGRFKKGNKPFNTKYNGHERINRDGYTEIRIKLGKYVLKHRYLWEKENGKIPAGHVVAFKDGDKNNFSISNLECISKIENMYRNSSHNYPDEIIPSLVLTKKIEHKLKTIENG